ncbi:adenylate/guanylate cyclase domain-containing protein [Inquilinus sp. NPDC058860]|uniref:adenylate/guanylate cyclase domain-containing protein n=1 Tax=Inquilinus sp. NPDC058860 TaxID=3346652 RepID=UPI0036989B96
MERRLCAILAADVVGYTRLMELDEAGTLAALKQRRRDILSPLVRAHHGRIIKVMGDGVLVEFGSAVNAIACAIELQKRMATANASLPADRQIVLRVAVNLCDVIVEGSDLYGGGVNIVARLQALTEPGGILVAGAAYDQVKNKVNASFADLGPQKLKNLHDPVRVYRVALDAPRAIQPDRPTDNELKQEKPSVAVLPFINVGSDPEQLYFSDGLTEDIITGLSRFRQLLVIARNSSFQYRDTAIDVRQAARDLGVRFVVEGSVRKAGARLRITAQLIEATAGNHIWAERFDRELTDVFAVQDEITQTIVASLVGRIEDADRRHALRKSIGDLSAYDLLLRGKHCLKRGSQEDVLKAREIFQRVIEMDPEYAAAYVQLAETYFYEAVSNWTASSEAAAERLFELGHNAAKLDDQDSRAHLCLAWGYWRVKGDFEMAEAQLEEAIALNTNDLDNYCLKGFLSTCMGKFEEGIWCASETIRRAPNLPEECLYSRVMAEYLLGRYGDAIVSFGRMSHPPVELLGWIAACYAELGRDREAHAAAMQFRERARAERAGPPDDNVEAWRAYWSKAFPAKERMSLERLFAGLRKAGVPV